MKRPRWLPAPLKNLLDNVDEIKSLLGLHEKHSGKKPGRRGRGLAALNKSGVVLMVACWEVFIENLSGFAFGKILNGVSDPAQIPPKVRACVTGWLKDDKNNADGFWRLAGTGWKKVLREHEQRIESKFIGPFQNPDADKIDNLFVELIGLNHLTKAWHWKGMSVARTTKKLSRLIKLRGDIAHKVRSSRTVTKEEAYDAVDFIQRLAGVSSNSVANHVARIIKTKSWSLVEYSG